MPSTRRQKAKTRKSREMDMMSDMDNLDVMLGNGSENPIERELTEAIEQSSVRSDSEANLYQRDDYRNFSHENSEYRQNDVRQSFETFSNEFNLRLSQEMDSMMAMVHSQINRAISTAISEKVLPEIQNIVSSMSSSGNRDTEASMSPSSQENRENPSGLKTKLLKKDSRSVGDLRDTTGRGSYRYSQVGANCVKVGQNTLHLVGRSRQLKYERGNHCTLNSSVGWTSIVVVEEGKSTRFKTNFCTLLISEGSKKEARPRIQRHV